MSFLASMGIGLGMGAIGGLTEIMRRKSIKKAMEGSGNPYQAQEQEILGNLMKRARGETPSIAEQSMQRGMQTGMANIHAGLKAMPSISAGARARMYSREAGAMGRALASSGGIAALQERQQAELSAADVIGNAANRNLQRGMGMADIRNTARGTQFDMLSALGQGLYQVAKDRSLFLKKNQKMNY